MKPNESVKTFKDFAASKGIDLNASTPRAGFEAMLEFRAETACTACSDDTLLYQWGSYDWGSGKQFELNITRQFIEAELEGDDAISQLSVAYKYKELIPLWPVFMSYVLSFIYGGIYWNKLQYGCHPSSSWRSSI